jgi:hypoxanthine phosphoribosyltransferase
MNELLIFTDPVSVAQATTHSIGGLADYGVLGIVALALSTAVLYVAKLFIAMHKENKERIVNLETRWEKYMSEDRVLLLDAIKDSRGVIANNTKLLEQSTELSQKILDRLASIPSS